MKTVFKLLWMLSLVGCGFVLSNAPVHMADTILKASRGEEKALLTRVERYCYRGGADVRTCRLYLREYTDYSFNHAEGPEIPLMESRPYVDQLRKDMAGTGIVKLKPLAKVIDQMGM